MNTRSQPDNEKKSSSIQSTSVSDKDAKDGSSLSSVVINHPSSASLFQVSFAVRGITCGSCVNNIIYTLNQISWVRTAEINLLTDSVSITFKGKEHLSDIIKAIEDVGYEATLG